MQRLVTDLAAAVAAYRAAQAAEAVAADAEQAARRAHYEANTGRTLKAWEKALNALRSARHDTYVTHAGVVRSACATVEGPRARGLTPPIL